MRIFVIGSVVPFRRHGEPGVTAAHIVLSELIGYLRLQGHDITLQCLFHPSRAQRTLTSAEETELELRRSDGMDVLPAVHPSEHVPPPQVERFRLLKLALSSDKRLRHFAPATTLRPMMEQRILASKADAVLIVWSPEGVAATHALKIPRVAYHGDVDPDVQHCRLRDRHVFDPDFCKRPFFRRTLQHIDQTLRVALFRGTHGELMQGVDRIANITACNSAYYTRNGHPHSMYAGNVWVDTGAAALASPPSLEEPFQIIGHVGYLNRTGGTYGLRFLLEGVMPQLERAMGGRNYDVHVIGGGEIAKSLKPYLNQPHLKVRGFVPDLDAELMRCHAFYILSNAGCYQAAYTRHLVGWSAGLCVIAHDKSRLAIPEIRHGENALLGRTPAEVADAIALACTNAEMNHCVRRGGRETFLRHFTPKIVGGTVERELRSATGKET